MNSAAKNFPSHDFFIYGFPLKSKITGKGNRELAAKKSYVEDTHLVRPAGKSLMVRSIAFTCPQSLVHIAKGEPSYAGLFRRSIENDMGGGGGT